MGYPFIADGCPVDEYTSLSPRLDLEDRFNTQTFKFQDSSFVYIQCDVIVCDLRVPNDPECQSTCRNDASRQTVNFLSNQKFSKSKNFKIKYFSEMKFKKKIQYKKFSK